MRTSWLVAAVLLAISGCTASDPYSRVNPVVYLCSNGSVADDAKICPTFAPTEVVKTECVFWQRSGFFDRAFGSMTFGDGSSDRNMCFYERAYLNQGVVDSLDQTAFRTVRPPRAPTDSETSDPSADEEADFQLTPAFERRRNETIDNLLNISDYNCNNFLERLFAKQTGVSFAKGLVNVVTSASAALTGFASVPAAAALNAANASLGGGLDAINSDVYYSKTAPDIAQAIRNKRAQLRDDIKLRELGTTPAAIGARAAEGAKARADLAAKTCDSDKTATQAHQKAAAAGNKSAIKKLSGDVDKQVKDCQAASDAAEIAKDAQDAATKLAAASTEIKSPQTPYTISAGTTDVINYDAQCSMLGGLSNLSQAVAATNPSPTVSKPTPSAAATPKPKGG
jgi:hypothetical protein